MIDSKKAPGMPGARTEDELDAALKGTFPASDPVSPPSHVEEEKERRRRVLEEDAKKGEPRSADVRTDSPGRILLSMGGKKNNHTEDALDEALQETFPASDPVSVDAAVHEAELRRRTRASRKPRAAKRKKKAPRRKAAVSKKKTAKKKPHGKKPSARKKKTRR